MINTLDDTDFGGKVDFCGERKTGEKPSESDCDQPITAHVRAQDRTQVAVVAGAWGGGGEGGALGGGENDDYCANLTAPLSKVHL